MANKEIKISTGTIKGRTPKVKDMQLVKDITNDIDREIALIGNLCEMTPSEVGDLELTDYKLVLKELLS